VRKWGLLPTGSGLAVCFYQSRSQTPQSAWTICVAVDRTGSSTGGPQSCHLTLKPCRRRFGCRGLGSRLQQLSDQAIGALALALEIGAVAGCTGFEPHVLGLQCLYLGRQQGGVAGLAIARWMWRMPDFSEVNAHQGLAIIRKRPREAEPAGKRTGSRWRDFQAVAQGSIGQKLNGHRLFS